MANPKLIAFDVFGTVVDVSGVPRAEMDAYAAHIRPFRHDPDPAWSPLALPPSWERLPAHPDAAGGLDRLRRDHLVVTLSNAPLGMMARLSKNAGLRWDAITPLELARVFKPHPRAYRTLCDVYGVAPAEVLVVTANEHFGDLEAARALGMDAVLIRGATGPKTIVDLADALAARRVVRDAVTTLQDGVACLTQCAQLLVDVRADIRAAEASTDHDPRS